MLHLACFPPGGSTAPSVPGFTAVFCKFRFQGSFFFFFFLPIFFCLVGRGKVVGKYSWSLLGLRKRSGVAGASVPWGPVPGRGPRGRGGGISFSPDLVLPVPRTPAGWKPLGSAPPRGFCTGWHGARCPFAAGRGPGPCPLGRRLSSHQEHCGQTRDNCVHPRTKSRGLDATGEGPRGPPPLSLPR